MLAKRQAKEKAEAARDKENTNAEPESVNVLGDAEEDQDVIF